MIVDHAQHNTPHDKIARTKPKTKHSQQTGKLNEKWKKNRNENENKTILAAMSAHLVRAVN